jgi:xanthine dehydrogenase small subunit
MGSDAAALEFLLNDERVRLDAPVPHATLLDFLRARGLTGAKEGCAEGECGACTVVMVGDSGTGTGFQAINSCLMLLPMAAHQEIYTVESLAVHGELAEAQRVMAAAGGSQCGYCTPGFVMSLFAEQYRPGRTGPCDTHALSGNLCRCTGYRPIRDAAHAVGHAPDDRFRARLSRPAPQLGRLEAPGFSRPSTIEECVAVLARYPHATLVAGASDLGVEANLRGTRWPHIVSVEGIAEMREIVNDVDRVRIGAAATLTEIEHRWLGAPGVIAEWLTLFASPQIRNRATLGGNLATASPIGDSAPLLLALDASVEIASTSGRRTVPLAGFFTGYRRTVLERGEILASIHVPKPFPELVRFYKIAKRAMDDISIVAAAMALDRDGAGRVRRSRFAFGGMAATPVRLVQAEQAIDGAPWNETGVERVQEVIERSFTPMSDHRGSAQYRLQVAKRLVEKFYGDRPQ